MAEDGPAEETRAVIEALRGIKDIPDPVRRARVISEVLRAVEECEPGWRELRRAVVLDLRAQDPAVPYRKIADMLKVSLGTVQNIERGHAGAWGTKARKKPQAKPDED